MDFLPFWCPPSVHQQLGITRDNAGMYTSEHSLEIMHLLIVFQKGEQPASMRSVYARDHHPRFRDTDEVGIFESFAGARIPSRINERLLCILFQDKTFFRTPFHLKDDMKSFGYRWDGTKRMWWTSKDWCPLYIAQHIADPDVRRTTITAAHAEHGRWREGYRDSDIIGQPEAPQKLCTSECQD